MVKGDDTVRLGYWIEWTKDGHTKNGNIYAVTCQRVFCGGGGWLAWFLYMKSGTVEKTVISGG